MLDLQFNSNEEWNGILDKYLDEFVLKKGGIQYDPYQKTVNILGERIGEGRKETVKVMGFIPLSTTMYSGIKCVLHFQDVEEYFISNVKDWNKDEVLDTVVQRGKSIHFLCESGVKILVRVGDVPKGYLRDI